MFGRISTRIAWAGRAESAEGISLEQPPRMSVVLVPGRTEGAFLSAGGLGFKAPQPNSRGRRIHRQRKSPGSPGASLRTSMRVHQQGLVRLIIGRHS